MVFVPAETQCLGGCAGSRQCSSEFRQLLCVPCWKVGTILGLGSINVSSIRPGVLPSGGLLGLLIYTCRESGWGFIPLWHCCDWHRWLLRCGEVEEGEVGAGGQLPLGAVLGTLSTACHSPGPEGPTSVLAMKERADSPKYSRIRNFSNTLLVRRLWGKTT